MWAVSIDPPEKLEEMRKNLGLTFVTLMDPGGETIKRYGIVNRAQGEIPHPTALVIDTQGVIRFLRVDEDYRRRPSNEDLLQQLREVRSKK